MTSPVYVSITGLRVRHVWQTPIFWRHAIASMNQAKRADGCLGAQARTIHGIHHTKSVWRNRAAMRAYLKSGAHLEAMRIFEKIATGKTYGFDTLDIPDWDVVHALWHEKGKEV